MAVWLSQYWLDQAVRVRSSRLCKNVSAWRGCRRRINSIEDNSGFFIIARYFFPIRTERSKRPEED